MAGQELFEFQPPLPMRHVQSFLSALDLTKLKAFLMRIAVRFPKQSCDIFTTDEKARLLQAFSLTTSNLDALIQFCHECFRQAAFHSLAPSVVHQSLLNAGLDEKIAEVFSEVWSAESKSIIDRLRQYSLVPHALDDVKWLLSVEAANDSQSKVNEPHCDVEFTLKNSCLNNETDLGTTPSSKLCCHMNRQQLSSFFQTLEAIQQELDSLTSGK